MLFLLLMLNFSSSFSSNNIIIMEFGFWIFHIFILFVKEVPMTIVQYQVPLKIYSKSGAFKTRRGSPVDRRPSNAEAPPIGKINPFSKMTVTCVPLMGFRKFWITMT